MASSNAPAISIPPIAARQLQTLLKHISRLKDVLEQSRQLQPGISVYEVLEPLAERVGISYRELEQITYALENLRIGAQQYGSVGEAIDRISQAVEKPLSSDLQKHRSDIERFSKEFASDNPIAVSFKAQKLAYLHERILRDAEIITDVRPVFDDSGKRILELMIAHTLVVTATNAGRTERVHFAIDAGDVLQLRKACERAIEKAKAIQSTFEKSTLNLKVKVLRGDQDGD